MKPALFLRLTAAALLVPFSSCAEEKPAAPSAAPVSSSAPTTKPAAAPAAKVDFAGDIAPIFERYCLKCHNPTNLAFSAGLYLTTKKDAFKDSMKADGKKTVVPGKPEESLIYTLSAHTGESGVLPDGRRAMPPMDADGKRNQLKAVDIAKLKQWIADGAAWPDDFEVGLRQNAMVDDPRERNLARQAAEHIAQVSPTEVKNYELSIPGSDVKFRMIAVPAGEFAMGSPEKEKNRGEDEGPQHKVKVGAFWMGATEVTWDEFLLFMNARNDESAVRKDTRTEVREMLDTLDYLKSFPTKPYHVMDYSMGMAGGYPAISITQHAANRYAMWLSIKTGQFYRLPTEAEWEYACRAGTITAYSFGDDPAALGDHAIYAANSSEKYQKVGSKKPNAWGFFDMHGNVAEWCLDQYEADAYGKLTDGVANPFNQPKNAYPLVLRGGGYLSDPELLRSAARAGSNPGHKGADPQSPKSIWYMTTPDFGFRLVRPVKTPSADEMFHYWTNGVEWDADPLQNMR